MYHIKQIWRVRQLLHNAEVTLKLKKCKSFAKMIDYLGHTFRASRLKLAEHLAKAVAKLETLTTQTKL